MKYSKMNDGIEDFAISPHAAFEMSRRGLEEKLIRQVLARPEQRYELRPGRIVMQSRVSMEKPERLFLVRVFVDIDRQPPEVVTAYRSSKIEKYWRREE